MRLLSHDPHALPVQPGEPDDEVVGPMLVHFHEVAVVENPGDDVFHVVGLVGLDRDDGDQILIPAVGIVTGSPPEGVSSMLF